MGILRGSPGDQQGIVSSMTPALRVTSSSRGKHFNCGALFLSGAFYFDHMLNYFISLSLPSNWVFLEDLFEREMRCFQEGAGGVRRIRNDFGHCSPLAFFSPNPNAKHILSHSERTTTAECVLLLLRICFLVDKSHLKQRRNSGSVFFPLVLPHYPINWTEGGKEEDDSPHFCTQE